MMMGVYPADVQFGPDGLHGVSKSMALLKSPFHMARRRDEGEKRASALMVPQAFIVEEPEGFVAPMVQMWEHNWTAEKPSELIADDVGT